MPLAKVSELLKDATEKKYGIPAINVFNYESVKWAVKAAEEEKMPIIVQFYPGFSETIATDEICDIIKKLVDKSTVPIGIHLDHSNRYEIAVTGIAAGFPSIMVDGSTLPFEENVQLTSDVTKCAKAMNIDVEAELGHIGSGMNMNDLTNKDFFTNTEQAVEFVERTGVDSLAIAVGNGHGDYIKTPELDFQRIRELRANLSVPLVMHGSSDIPDEQLRNAVNYGIAKFNIATEYQRVFYNNMKEFIQKNKRNDVYIYQAIRYLERPCIEFVKGKIRLLNPNGYHL